MALDLLYFAGVREAIGASGETVTPPTEVTTIADLIGWLARQSPAHAEALSDPARIRAAIGDAFATPDAPIAGAREISLFPPVTGG